MVQERYVYHIKDSYFEVARDANLMCNKEDGHSRPTFMGFEDPQVPGLYWMVPMSTRYEKYKAIRDKNIKKYGKCTTIILGTYDGKDAAFLIQNMFPITEQYIDHVHARKGNPVPVKYALAKEIKKNLQQTRQMVYRGKKLVFTDIKKIEERMLEELFEQSKEASQKKINLDERIALARGQSERGLSENRNEQINVRERR